MYTYITLLIGSWTHTLHMCIANSIQSQDFVVRTNSQVTDISAEMLCTASITKKVVMEQHHWRFNGKFEMKFTEKKMNTSSNANCDRCDTTILDFNDLNRKFEEKKMQNSVGA